MFQILGMEVVLLNSFPLIKILLIYQKFYALQLNSQRKLQLKRFSLEKIISDIANSWTT